MELSQWQLFALCLALNLAFGLPALFLHLPVYLDSVGTILATRWGGLRLGIGCGLAYSIVASIKSPTYGLYFLTVVGVAYFTKAARPYGFLDRWAPTIVCAIALAVLCAFLSAPITFLLNGNTMMGEGPDRLKALFLTQQVVNAGLFAEFLDKTLTCVLCLLLARWLRIGRPEKDKFAART